MKPLEKRIAARLLASGDLTEKDLERALSQYSGKVPLQDLLVAQGYTDPKNVCRALAEANNMQFIELGEVTAHEDAIALIKPEQAWRHEVLPVWLDEECLTIVLAEPNNVFAADELKVKVGVPVVTLIAERNDLKSALTRYYGPSPFSERHLSRQENQKIQMEQLRQEEISREATAIALEDDKEDHSSAAENDSFYDKATVLEENQATTDQKERDVYARHREHQRQVREIKSSGDEDTVFENSSEELLREVEDRRVQTGAYEEPIQPVDRTLLKSTEDSKAGSHLLHLLNESLDQRTEELELTPLEHSMRVRFRRNEVWEEAPTYPLEYHEDVIACLRRLAQIESLADEPAVEQKFLFPTKRGEFLVYLYLEKTETGPRAVMRFTEGIPLLNDPLLNVALPREEGLNLNTRLMERGGGLLLVSSPAQRPLSRFYASLLRSLSRGGRDVLSLERPPQRRVPGVTSINCPSNEVMLASLANASFMNPDVLGVSSIENGTVFNRVMNVAVRGTTTVACLTAPDSETAQACLKAARIDAMNLVRGLAGHLHFVETQRLCPRCREPITNEASLPEWASELKADFCKAQGCEYCKKTGYRGTVLMSDFWTLNQSRKDGTLQALHQMDKDILALSLAGEIDPREFAANP